jgi:hypothetical protein
MGWLLICVGLYAVLGLLTSGIFLCRQWSAGDDITMSDLGFALLRVPMWPIGICIIIADWAENRNLGEIVVIRGSRSARVLRSLREDS